jgi:hypothetical protein
MKTPQVTPQVTPQDAGAFTPADELRAKLAVEIVDCVRSDENPEDEIGAKLLYFEKHIKSMHPENEPGQVEPPSRHEVFIAHMDKAIAFHRTNQNDPHGIGNAVMCALIETRNAYAKTYRLPVKT